MRKGHLVRFTKVSLLLLAGWWVAGRLLCVREVHWEGSAPISFEACLKVESSLIGQPLWSVSSQSVKELLKGEIVDRVTVQKALPFRVVIRADGPDLVGCLSNGETALLVDRNGKVWQEVPVWATHLPTLILPSDPNRVPILNGLAAVLEQFARENLSVRCASLNSWGELTVGLEEGVWVRFGGPAFFREKIKLVRAVLDKGLLQQWEVLDVSVPAAVTGWLAKSGKVTGSKIVNE
ncbi:MAG: hypothetical protein NZ959_12225 [Armatimonadetes bacterium]|nr:hypothetical protein [Armatimonadota bacterium]MDW8123064.1 hypothetical protein [Armatimonadota bacterium]